jgi:hypothetical protein
MQAIDEPGNEKSLGKRLITSFVVSEFFLIIGNLGVRVCQRELALPIWALTLIALITAIPMFLFAITFFRTMRSDLDEMLQRIVFEGLGYAMIIFIPLAGLYVNARATGLFTTRLDPPELLLLPSILVVIGVLLAGRRFK